MSLTFSSVIVYNRNEYKEFTVPGIPEKKEDLEQDASFAEYAKQFNKKTYLNAKVQTYVYDGNEEGLKNYSDLFALLKRDYRFVGEHCKPTRVSEFGLWIG